MPPPHPPAPPPPAGRPRRAAGMPYAPDRTPAGPRDRGPDPRDDDPLDDHPPHARRRTLQREAA